MLVFIAYVWILGTLWGIRKDVTYFKIRGHVASPIAPGSRTTGGVISTVVWSIGVQIGLSRWRRLWWIIV